MNAENTLLLVDGSSYLYRAYLAMPNLRAEAGNPASAATGALRGIINMLRALQKEIPASFAACVFDAGGHTFRDDIYPAYKANRSPMPDDLRAQVEPIHRVVQALGWPLLKVAGVEADDVIATLAQQAAQQNMQVVISSGDKDFAQLVNEHILIYDSMNGKRRDVAGVTAEFGVAPECMIDFQTLVGDSVDNVPGLPGVGAVTAAKWLLQYGSLDALIAHAEEIKGVRGAALRTALQGSDWPDLSRQLVTIRRDVPGLPAPQELRMASPDTPALATLYRQYGFKSLLKALQTEEPGQDSAAADTGTASTAGTAGNGFRGTPDYTTITDWQNLEAFLARWLNAPLVALDLETTSLDQMHASIVGISCSIGPGEAAYIPLGHDYPDAREQLPLDRVLEKLRPWLEDAGHAKLGQHIKYDRHVLANHGINVRGYRHDTMLQSYVLEADKPHGLESLAERHLNRQGSSYESLCGKGARQIPFSQVDIEKASHYACEDADFTFDVHQALWPRIEADNGLKEIYQLEIATSEVLFRMERLGVQIDSALLAGQSKVLGERIMELQQQAYELAGQPFNLSSPKQLAEIFFDKLGMPVVKKTATGARSTNEEVLEKLAQDYPLPARILEHRNLSKLKSTYTDKLGQLAQASSGRVHTYYAQAVAVTGRLSSAEPNLQNIPVRTPEGRRIREAFVAAPGFLIASADYSQIELRIMAHLSGDQALLQAFAAGEDIHRATASEVFNVAVGQVSAEQRRYAKVINFGLIYGMGRFGLARNLNIDNTAAANYIERYFERYPGVRRYMQETKEQARSQQYVKTVFGRRLYLPDILSPNGIRRAAAERAAINAPMQGTAADLIKKSMVALQALIDEHRPEVRMIMQVHDELIFEVPEAALDWVREHVPAAMAGVASLKVPLIAELGIGRNWEQAH